jgi:hypothetical protein
MDDNFEARRFTQTPSRPTPSQCIRSGHPPASLYEACEPAGALRIARKLQRVHTPRHGSWLHVAESELSVLTRQSLARRSAEQDTDTVAAQAATWSTQRNEVQIGVGWHFTTQDARTRLKRLYLKFGN